MEEKFHEVFEKFENLEKDTDSMIATTEETSIEEIDDNVVDNSLPHLENVSSALNFSRIHRFWSHAAIQSVGRVCLGMASALSVKGSSQPWYLARS